MPHAKGPGEKTSKSPAKKPKKTGAMSARKSRKTGSFSGAKSPKTGEFPGINPKRTGHSFKNKFRAEDNKKISPNKHSLKPKYQR